MKRSLKKIGSKVTYANVVSTLCLFLVLGGGAAYAASHLPKNSVGAKQIRKGAVGPSKLSAAAVATLAGSKGPRGATGATGPQGPAGAPGAPGAVGSAKAWALVNNAGVVIRSSGNVAVNEIEPGQYCVAAGPWTTANSAAIATLDYSDSESGADDQVVVSNGNGSSFFNNCALGQFEVRGVTYNETEENNSPIGFVFMIP
ncbi:MAG TPA: hypothetical protein VHZ54_18270 [Solirubrobacterales bacterium]|jgi:hypothetical protein|nr:hypothetical protein [Solirubrobacterales bacterium]